MGDCARPAGEVDAGAGLEPEVVTTPMEVTEPAGMMPPGEFGVVAETVIVGDVPPVVDVIVPVLEMEPDRG